MRRIRHALVFVVLLQIIPLYAATASPTRQVVIVRSEALSLRAVVWRPEGRGPFPAILFNHGGGHGHKSKTFVRDQRFYRREADLLGSEFARDGFVFLYLYRRGGGLSEGQGTYSGDVLDAELEANGPEAMNRLQVRLLENDHLDDALAGLAWLRSQRDVDPQRLAVIGHSFGGSLALLVAEREPSLRAIVTFAAAAGSWPGSPELQQRLLTAVREIRVPVMLIHAANDYSTAPGNTLAAEMERHGKPHRLVIYPPYGTTEYEGHNFIDLNVEVWRADVLAFLRDRMALRVR